jgi:pilus assembly protein CpaC
MVKKTSKFSACAGTLCLVLFFTTPLWAQQTGNEIEYRITRDSQRLEMVVNTSRILSLDKEVPRAMVNNPELVRVVPLSPSKVQISATKPGVTQVNLWDEDGKLYTVSLIIIGDAQELEMLLTTEFPQASLKVRPLATSVVLSGRVDRSEDVSRIVRMAEDYYPKVINNIQVGGVQQVLLNVQVMEVSRTKLRAMGFDWANFGNSDFVVQSVSGTLGSFTQTGTATGTGASTVTFGLVGPDNSFFGFLEALRDNNLAKILAEPKLLTVSGRPASFNAGGEFPILVPQSLGTISVEYKQFGTRVDFVPIVLGNGNIRLEVRPQVSELDNANGVTLSGNRIPGLRTRWVDTAVEMRAGQTLALAGLIQTRTESQNRGIPWLADLPWAGAAFRRVEEQQNEIELVVTVRPELVDALDPHEVPQCYPGQQSGSPNDVELYFRGYIEVPNCCPDGSCANCQGAAATGPTIEMPAGTPTDVTVPPIGEPAASPVTDPTGALVPRRPLNAQSVQYRPVRTGNQSIMGRQAQRPASAPERPSRTEDPGLFGRVGYDVLDYKE